MRISGYPVSRLAGTIPAPPMRSQSLSLAIAQCHYIVRRVVSKTLKDISPMMKIAKANEIVAGRDGAANVHRLTPTYTSRLPRARQTARLWGNKAKHHCCVKDTQDS